MSTSAPQRAARRAAGRRVRRMGEQRRQRLRRRGGALVGVLLVAGLAIGAVLLATRDRGTDDGTRAQETERAGGDSGQDTLLLLTHSPDGGPADSVTLLAAGESPAFVLFLPVGTLVDIPGYGLDRLGLAHQYGGAALLEAAVENTLGIAVDHVAATTPSGLASFLGGDGGLEIDVPERLIARAPDGSATERFRTGPQFLDGQRLAEYWAFPGQDGNELARFPRQQLVLGALLDALADEGARERMIGDGAPELAGGAEPDALRRVFAELARARSAGQLSFSLLPVEPFGAPGPDGQATYRAEDEEIARLAAGPLAGSVPAGGGGDSVRIEVLNGVGTPGIGQAVDGALDGAGFRIVRTENARSFDFTETRILVYDESPVSLAAAQRVRDLLGVGSIQVSRQPQTLVDLTIVVGADFKQADFKQSETAS